MKHEVVLTAYGMTLPDKVVTFLNHVMEEKELVDRDELEKLKIQRFNISADNYKLLKLFVKAYDSLAQCVSRAKNEEEDYSSTLDYYLKSIDFDFPNLLFKEYKEETTLGNQWVEGKIKELITKHRNEYLNLIDIFFKVFGDEE